ncbi:MAG: hypothetical protein F4213_01795 [Boseongicola sp. SB0677_bin_26]|nr:hypothetical protein [Boseongicola sp. SB0665_bin_10]MYG24749.1 hypothetical protein [Boseongicola sp. SB0677_bin_26]
MRIFGGTAQGQHFDRARHRATTILLTMRRLPSRQPRIDQEFGQHRGAIARHWLDGFGRRTAYGEAVPFVATLALPPHFNSRCSGSRTAMPGSVARPNSARTAQGRDAGAAMQVDEVAPSSCLA